jgi:hypothetical protein
MPSMTRLLHEDRDTELPAARAEGASLWLDRDDVARATGWTWKPEGMCKGDLCMPLPRHGAPMADGDRLDVAAFWRHAGRPVAASRDGDLWVLGEDAATRADALASGEAPDVALPDLDGRMHALSGFRGRRVFLVAWASW